jgi:hypothetical protein
MRSARCYAGTQLVEVNLPYEHRSLEGRKEPKRDSVEGFTAVVPSFRGHYFVPTEKHILGFWGNVIPTSSKFKMFSLDISTLDADVTRLAWNPRSDHPLPLTQLYISTKEYSLAQRYVFKLINQAKCFSYTAIIKPIHYHLLSYIC